MADARPTCRVIHSGEAYQGLQGLIYFSGLTDASVRARAICMTVATIPGGARAKAHLHRGIETAAYVIAGEIEIWFGERLEQRLIARDGDYSYVPADMPHVVFNRSDLPCEAVVAHSAANDQEGIVLLPELDALVK
jgi:uncharacterized RmlC-like cupin family protein